MPSKNLPRRSPFRSQIARSAVEAFLERELADWSELKSAAPVDVLRALNDHGVEFIGDAPWGHQTVSTLIGLETDAFAYFLDPGMGKSRIVLDVLRTRWRKGQLERVLILSPSETTVENWAEQCALYAPDMRVVKLTGHRDARLEALGKSGQLFLMNYGGLQVFMTEHNKQKRRRVPVRGLVERFASQWNAVVYDESHNLGHHDTLLFSLCSPISARARFRFALTGTPFGRDPHMLWSQLYLLDGGATLGTLGMFRAAFFNEKINYWSGFPEYVFASRSKPQLNRLLRNVSIRYEDTECQDLPPITYQTIHVDLPEDAGALGNRIKSELRQAHGNYTEVESAFIRMRQLSSGYVTAKGLDTDGEDSGKRIEIEFECPKLEALLELLDEIGPDQQVIVFHEFIKSGERVSKALTKAKIRHVRLYGGTKDKPAVLAEFTKDRKCRVLLANHKSGGAGLNLQMARYIIFYESPVDPITRRQAEKRSWRGGQTEHVHVYDLVTRETYDERILQFVKEGRNLFKEICGGSEQGALKLIGG